LYLGKEIPQEVSPWEDPLPEINFKLPEEKDIVELKKEIRKAVAEGKTTVSDLVYVTWSSAATFRISDKRGGANGAKKMFDPFRSFEVNMPERLDKVLRLLEEIKKDFDLKNQKDGKKISIADLIILSGDTGIEVAAERAGYIVNIPFFPGRVDTKPEFIDTFTAKFLEPIYDGFRNYLKSNIKFVRTPEELLIDRAHLLALTPPEMTALVGGLRVLNCNFNYSPHGVFTKRPETLTNDFFVNLLDEDLEWKEKEFNHYEGRSRKTGELKWTATRVDLIFGHDHRLRALSEAYASDDGEEVFIKNFLKGWIKVMHLDRFDLHKERKLDKVLENIIILPKF
jgi:catalase-peroxidase